MRLSSAITGLLLLSLGTAGAQGPPAGGAPPQQGPGQGQRPVTIQDIIPVEGVMNFVTFQQNLPDQKFLDVRDVLQSVFDGRAAVVEQMRSGQMEQAALRDTVFALRADLTDGLTAVLDDQQTQELFRAMGVQGSEPGGPGGPAGAAAAPPTGN